MASRSTRSTSARAAPSPRQQVRESLSGHDNLYAGFIKPTNNFLERMGVSLFAPQAKKIAGLSAMAERGEITSTDAMVKSSMGFFSASATLFKRGEVASGFTHMAGGFAEGFGASKMIADSEGAQGKLDTQAQMFYDRNLY